MMLTFLRPTVLLLWVLAPPLAAQRVETGFLNRVVERDGATYPYQVYVPADYTSTEAWPVILFLHGAGERGADGLLQTTVGLAPAVRSAPARFPAIIVLPSSWTGCSRSGVARSVGRGLDVPV